MGTISRNFDVVDFQCRCAACAENPSRPVTDKLLVNIVQNLRDRMGKPIIVSCGVRCEAHNRAVGGAPDSRHLPHHRDAVDIAYSSSQEAYELVYHAMISGNFTCIEACKRHIHLDIRPTSEPILLVSLGE